MGGMSEGMLRAHSPHLNRDDPKILSLYRPVFRRRFVRDLTDDVRVPAISSALRVVGILQARSHMDRRRPRNPPVRPLVLLVEGHEDTREMYAFALSASGFDVVTARDGEAYVRAWAIHPDVIVADLPTPHQDGWTSLHVLKRDARTRDIPVVAISGFGQPSPRDSVERETFAAVFPKPCLPDALAAGLRELVNGRRDVHAWSRRGEAAMSAASQEQVGVQESFSDCAGDDRVEEKRNRPTRRA
jgi:two-component system, cell cycle response regulator DivK